MDIVAGGKASVRRCKIERQISANFPDDGLLHSDDTNPGGILCEVCDCVLPFHTIGHLSSC
jgi:hypothetical protein